MTKSKMKKWISKFFLIWAVQVSVPWFRNDPDIQLLGENIDMYICIAIAYPLSSHVMCSGSPENY